MVFGVPAGSCETRLVPAMRIPNELHRLRGTYRQDRHGPPEQIQVSRIPVRVVGVVSADEHGKYACPYCERLVDLVLFADFRWGFVHPDTDSPDCSP